VRIEIVANRLLPPIVLIDWYDFLGRALQNRRYRRFLNGAHRVHLVEVTIRTNHKVLPVTRWVFKRGHRISPRSTICLRFGAGVGEHRSRFRENNAFEKERRNEREQQKTDHGAPPRAKGFGSIGTQPTSDWSSCPVLAHETEVFAQGANVCCWG
jgi:hypothetical protein